MDKGTQEEVVPIFTSEEKQRYLHNFMEARLRGNVQVESFARMASYMINPKFKSLAPEIIPNIDLKAFTIDEAHRYFDFLIGILTNPNERKPEFVREASEQLFFFINIMIEDIVVREDLIPNWPQLLKTMAEEFTKLEQKIENRDKEITDNFELLLAWKRDSQPTIDAAKDYFQGMIGRIGGKKKDE
jgi:hypothetical protein